MPREVDESFCAAVLARLPRQRTPLAFIEATLAVARERGMLVPDGAAIIDAWLACDRDGSQWLIYGGEPEFLNGVACHGEWGAVLCETRGHDIAPGECRQVKLQVKVVDSPRK